MQDKFLTAGITLLVSAITALGFMFFVKVPVGYNDGLMAGIKLGAEQQTKLIQDEVEKNSVQGVFTASSTGGFYLRTK